MVPIMEDFEEDVDVEGVYIQPPDENVTEEDSHEEDVGGRLDNLSSRQLQSNAKFVFYSGRRIDRYWSWICYTAFL